MKTVSINVMNLCVPCENRCRYCLLSYNGSVDGADYKRSEEYAKRFYSWLRINRPDLTFLFGFGYSMEHPNLLGAIQFCQSIGSPTGEFLQFDGMKFRSNTALHQLLLDLKAGGVKHINMTFYGTEKYHDRFAARAGDYRFMMNALRIGSDLGLEMSVGVPLTHENVAQADPLLKELQQYKPKRVYYFIPHCEGRGKSLEDVRFTSTDFSSLSETVKAHFNMERFRPEKDWVTSAPHPLPHRRVLTLTLTKDNIDLFEQMSFDETIAFLEQLDNAYYDAIPNLNELIKLYGDPVGEKLYSQRDLLLTYQRRYIADHHLTLYDVNDERQCFSRRF